MRADHLAACGGDAFRRRAPRVHLARAVAVRADMLLLDEPFAGLDAETRAACSRTPSQCCARPTRATLVVVHDRAEAWALADRLLMLIDGELVAEGPPRELLERPPTSRWRASSALMGPSRARAASCY